MLLIRISYCYCHAFITIFFTHKAYKKKKQINIKHNIIINSHFPTHYNYHYYNLKQAVGGVLPLPVLTLSAFSVQLVTVQVKYVVVGDGRQSKRCEGLGSRLLRAYIRTTYVCILFVCTSNN